MRTYRNYSKKGWEELKKKRLLRLRILLLLGHLRCTNSEIVADRATGVLFPLFPAIPLGFTGPIDLARLTAVHL